MEGSRGAKAARFTVWALRAVASGLPDRGRVDGYFSANRILPAIGSGLELKRWGTIGIGARGGKMGLLMGSHFCIPRPEFIQQPALFFR